MSLYIWGIVFNLVVELISLVVFVVLSIRSFPPHKTLGWQDFTHFSMGSGEKPEIPDAFLFAMLGILLAVVSWFFWVFLLIIASVVLIIGLAGILVKSLIWWMLRMSKVKVESWRKFVLWKGW